MKSGPPEEEDVSAVVGGGAPVVLVARPSFTNCSPRRSLTFIKTHTNDIDDFYKTLDDEMEVSCVFIATMQQ